MNDLVSEYQQYQDATAEGESDADSRGAQECICLSVFQKRAKVSKAKTKNVRRHKHTIVKIATNHLLSGQ